MHKKQIHKQSRDLRLNRTSKAFDSSDNTEGIWSQMTTNKNK